MEVCPLTTNQLEILKEKILKEREQNLNFYPDFNFNLEGNKDNVDIANSEILGEVMAKIKKRLIEKERKFQEALSKISKMSYGICEECGESIGFHRLIKYPSANLCIICKEESERGN